MNRREFFQTSAAVAACAALPDDPHRVVNEPLDLYWMGDKWPIEQLPVIHSDVQWDIAEEAWLVAAWCYDPPIFASDLIYHKENLETAEQRLRVEVAIGVLTGKECPVAYLSERLSGEPPR